MNKYKDKIKHILDNAKKYHDKFYDVERFRGPDLHFHRRTLEMITAPDFDLYLEFIYATLASWGMHRMGQGGPKMKSFDVFRNSIRRIRQQIEDARRINYQNMNDADWGLLGEIFSKIEVMASGTRIVGNSKVMAHLLPNIIPPIDRQYTLRYLTGSANIRNGIDREWNLMRDIVEHFFLPIATNGNFKQMVDPWIDDQATYPWDTSILKVIDNLIIGAVLVDREKEES